MAERKVRDKKQGNIIWTPMYVDRSSYHKSIDSEIWSLDMLGLFRQFPACLSSTSVVTAWSLRGSVAGFFWPHKLDATPMCGGLRSVVV